MGDKYRRPRVRQRLKTGKMVLSLTGVLLVYFMCSRVFRGKATPPEEITAAVYAEDALQINTGKVSSGGAQPIIAKELAEIVAHEEPDPDLEADPVAAPTLQAEGLYKLAASDIDGRETDLAEYKGKVTLVVNVASACGYTATNYQGLEALYREMKDSGVVVLAFPCNQFGQQEPGNEPAIKAFAEDNYGVTFPLFSKIDVNGPNTHPVYSFLKESPPFNRDIEWNFVKFLVDKQGNVVQRFDSNWNDAAIKQAIRSIL